jgi:hypothetical protein
MRSKLAADSPQLSLQLLRRDSKLAALEVPAAMLQQTVQNNSSA